jgi:hypothetical protein
MTNQHQPNTNPIMDWEDEIESLKAQLDLERRCNLILQNAFLSLYNRFHSKRIELENEGIINTEGE